MMFTLHTKVRRWRRAVETFLRDEQGNISIETVIILPLLLFATVGGLTYWNAFHSNSRTAKVAYTISDIMSRHDVVDGIDMAYLWDLQNKMLPADVTERTLRISSVCFEDGTYHVLWSFTAAGVDAVEPEQLTVEEIPIDVMPSMMPRDSVILVELGGSWEPQFLQAGIKGARWNNTLVTKPRWPKIIPHTDLNPSNICPTDT